MLHGLYVLIDKKEKVLSILCGISLLTFVDLDECQSPDACGANHVCYNTVGSYRCECPIGLAADSSAQDPLNPVCVGRNLTCVEVVDLSHTDKRKQVDFLREKLRGTKAYRRPVSTMG